MNTEEQPEFIEAVMNKIEQFYFDDVLSIDSLIMIKIYNLSHTFLETPKSGYLPFNLYAS